MTNTCQIQWIDAFGNPTPDCNEAIGRVRCEAHDVNISGRFGNRPMHVPASQWFNICACHAERLNEPDMQWWTLEVFEAAR